ncbi:hypothetical protein EYC84_007389 [Monilinia fructicola]|uniref:Uncharacterized protein n=1 Tax=Monilinia fructicola TaxID=38448 RepID=A0A5M9JJ25_MONFR|nr:hypothetical protein EYC84_007389 [Monilinia fructicola]
MYRERMDSQLEGGLGDGDDRSGGAGDRVTQEREQEEEQCHSYPHDNNDERRDFHSKGVAPKGTVKAGRFKCMMGGVGRGSIGLMLYVGMNWFIRDQNEALWEEELELALLVLLQGGNVVVGILVRGA